MHLHRSAAARRAPREPSSPGKFAAWSPTTPRTSGRAHPCPQPDPPRPASDRPATDRPSADPATTGRKNREICRNSRFQAPAGPRRVLASPAGGGTVTAMRDPDDDDETPPPREDRLFGSSGFRRKISEGLTGLLDPDGALGKGKDFVTGVSQATKTEVVRMVSAEVRNFLDGMDTVDLMQRVIAGLVIDVKAEIRFSIDPNGQLKSSITTKESEVRSAGEPGKPDSRPEPRAARPDSKPPEPRAAHKPEPRPEPGPHPSAPKPGKHD